MKIVQITDTHLFANDADEMYGVKCNHAFNAVMSRFMEEDLAGTDMIFLTGDVSQDKSVESYEKVVTRLSRFNIPVYWIAGNHDHSEHIESVFSKNNHFHRDRTLTLPYWHMIFLDTNIDQSDSGYLAEKELLALEHEIMAAPFDKKLAIVMHHHPSPVNTPLIDNYILKNADDFWEIVKESKVELIICGHVHGDYSFQVGNTMIESSPATCIQWLKGTTDLKTVMKIGYKIYQFDRAGYSAVSKTWPS